MQKPLSRVHLVEVSMFTLFALKVRGRRSRMFGGRDVRVAIIRLVMIRVAMSSGFRVQGLRD